MIAKLTTFLSGKKTYIAAVILVVLSGLKAQGYIDEATFQVATATMGALGLAALRAGVNKNK